MLLFSLGLFKLKFPLELSIQCSYKHELEEWDEVCEKKRIRVEENKQVFLSEDIDLSPDSKTLESFLTPEQLEILNQPLLSNPNFLAETSRTLDTIVSRSFRCQYRYFKMGWGRREISLR